MNARRRFIKAARLVGLLCLLGPLYGLVGTVIGMHQAFATLGASGIGDPRSLARAVGEMLTVNIFGICLLPLGIAIYLTACFLERKLREIEPPPLPQPAA